MTMAQQQNDDGNPSEDWTDIPLFAPEGAEIPVLPEGEGADNGSSSSAIGALSHMLYDEETPEEKSDLYRTEGNRLFKLGTKSALHAAVRQYTKAVQAAGEEASSLSTALNNRAAAHLKLGNYGYALTDALKAGELAPLNVKAHYRAAVSATQLERLKVATDAVTAGLKACKKGHGIQSDITLLKQQRVLIDKKMKIVEQRDKRLREREQKTHSVKDMLSKRAIRVSRRSCYAQQREYERTAPRWDDESQNWCWPLLLVYPTQAHGEQSDYLESVSEDVTLRQIMELVFDNSGQEAPWWDVDNAYGDINNLQVLLKRKLDEGKSNTEAGEDGGDTDDEEEEEEANGWKVEDRVKWTVLKEDDTIGQVVTRKKYVVPLYPVLHIVPKHVARSLVVGNL